MPILGLILGRHAAPLHFARLAHALIVPLAVVSASLFAVGLVWSLFIAPPDYQHGEAVRIMFVHVPAAWGAMSCYALLSVASIVFLYRGHVVADLIARAAAPVGLTFTALALFTGAVWGKPMWGSWWVWDARLTSTFIQFFIFLGVIVVRRLTADPMLGGRLTAMFTLCGAVNIPIIHFSVVWWNALHQPPSLSLSDGSSLHPSILQPLLVMSAAFASLLATLTLIGAVTEMHRRRDDNFLLAESQNAQKASPETRFTPIPE